MKPFMVLDPETPWDERHAPLARAVTGHFRGRTEPIRILEAGCGLHWNLPIDVEYRLTGIDVSREALEVRQANHGDLDEIVVANLMSVELPDESFDLIFCSYVLEHIDGARHLLDRFLGWLKPSGLMVLAFPDRDSVFGFITRVTPHWFHVLYYRRIRNQSMAGKPGYPPFPTFYDHVVSRRGLHAFCRETNCSILTEYGDAMRTKQLFGPVSPLVTGLLLGIELVSLRRLSASHQNLMAVIKKPD